MSESTFTLSQQDLMCAEAFKEVVQELGSEGNKLVAAVEEDETVFCPAVEHSIHSISNILESSSTMNSHPKAKDTFLTPIIPKYWTNYDIYCNSRIPNKAPVVIKTEPEYNNEDQKYMNWNGQYDAYNEQAMYAPQAPLSQAVAQIPANVDYAGELDFDILISSHTANRNSWIYSSQLKKVFINMQNVLPVDVKRNPADVDLYLRATLLYSLPQYAQELVERCSTHVDSRMTTNRDVDPTIMKHVLRCSNVGSAYMGNTDIKEHLSVMTPLGQPQAGMDTVRINYQFMCKNSCPSGMNRRAVDVIFTLEDCRGNVLGRRKLAVRVCSCPKRDKEKEEKEFRDSNQQPHPQGSRKRKFSTLNRPRSVEHGSGHVDDAVYMIPSFQVVGFKNAELILTVARNQQLYEINAGSLDEQKLAKAKECYEELDNILKNLSNDLK